MAAFVCDGARELGASRAQIALRGEHMALICHRGLAAGDGTERDEGDREKSGPATIHRHNSFVSEDYEQYSRSGNEVLPRRRRFHRTFISRAISGRRGLRFRAEVGYVRSRSVRHLGGETGDRIRAQGRANGLQRHAVERVTEEFRGLLLKR